MECVAVKHNQIRPTGGNSGLRPNCNATSVGFFIGDNTMRDKAKQKAYMKVWRQANTEKTKAHFKEYYKTNSEKMKVQIALLTFRHLIYAATYANT